MTLFIVINFLFQKGVDTSERFYTPKNLCTHDSSKEVIIKNQMDAELARNLQKHTDLQF